MCGWQEVKTQSCLKTELSSGERCTPVAFGTQAPVQFGACGDSVGSLKQENPRPTQRAWGTKGKASSHLQLWRMTVPAKPWAIGYFVNSCPQI